MKRIVWLIALLFLFPSATKAYQCTSASHDVLQEFANNITVSIEEQEIDGKVNFAATFAGVYSGLRVEQKNTLGVYFGGVDETLGEFNVKNLKPGNTYVFEVYGADNCFGYKFRTITLEIPYYNSFYKETICEKAREYSLCQKWNKVELSYDEFSKKVNEYIQSKINDDDKNIVYDENESLFWKLYDNYYWPCLVGLIAFLGILIYLWIKENKKNKL